MSPKSICPIAAVVSKVVWHNLRKAVLCGAPHMMYKMMIKDVGEKVISWFTNLQSIYSFKLFLVKELP